MANYNFADITIIARMGAGSIMLFLGMYVLLKNPYTRLNRFFGAYALTATLWAFSLGMTAAANTPELAILWNKIGNIGALFMTPCFLLFILTFIKKIKLSENFFTYTVLFGISVAIYLAGTILTQISPESVFKGERGWVFPSLLATKIAEIWVPGLMLIGLILCYSFYRKNENESERKQALFILITGVAPLVLIVISQVILPKTTVSPMTFRFFSVLSASSTLVISAALLYAVSKYRLFILLTPAANAEKIIETIKDAIVIINTKLQIEFVNSYTANLFGYKAGEMASTTLKESLFKDENDWNNFYENVITRLKSGTDSQEIEVGLKAKTGGTIDSSLTGSGIENERGILVGFILTIKDIRQTKQLIRGLEEKSLELAGKIKALEFSAQETEKTRLATLNILDDVEEARISLQKEKERIEIIILSLADGLLVMHKEGVLSMNPAAEEIFQVKKENIIGNPLSVLKRNPNFSAFFKFKENNQKKLIFRKDLLLPKPEKKLQISVTPIGREGELVTLHDVSREKLIERMKTEFVSLAAHQLRTPLSAIKWTLRMLLDGDLGKITKEQRDFLEKTYQSNERMISLINDLLNVTRIEEGRYLSKLVPIKIIDVVQSIVSSYQDEMRKKKIKFDFITPKEKIPEPEIEADVEKISSAIENLIDNALRYTPLGGQVTVGLKYGKKEVELLVKDTGVGIPKDQQERIFSKFFRASNVIRLETEGSGLGLFIMKNIIEAHGGKVWFETEEGKGSTFHVIFPIKDGATKKKI